MKNLIAAILKVMAEVEGIDKSMTVGVGNNSYKGVADKDVKRIIGKSMQKHGLIILPVGIEKHTQIDRWTENTEKYGEKTKQSVFSEVVTKYLLCHESGATIELCGYGHGVDSQDKAAGKCTTYALKYTLLYTFLVETGLIDDADAVHSDSIPIPKRSEPEQSENKPTKWLNVFVAKNSTVLTPEWTNVIQGIESGKIKTIDDVKKHYLLNKEVFLELQKLIEKKDYNSVSEPENAPF
jgi:hypothetical protein